MSEHKIRAGDHVLHKPSGEDWIVMWANHETGYMAPAGWPACRARIEDVLLIRPVNDAGHNAFLDGLKRPAEGEAAEALALYRPAPAAAPEGLDPAGLARAREAYIRELVQRPDQDVGTMVAAIVRAYRAGSAGNV